MQLAYYCYVEGARKPEDITKKMVNKAQTYIGKTQYNITMVAKTQLRGDTLRLPNDVIKKMQMLFKALCPVFARMKSELEYSRTNMVNFTFVSRILCQLLGYDVFLPLFTKFDMDKSSIRHCVFMRKMFHEIGWVWEDGKFTSIPDKVLDEYQRSMEVELDNEEELETDV